MQMASHRRVYNFGPQHRVPSIEVYSSSSPPRDSEGEYIYYGPRTTGPSTGRTSRTSPTAASTQLRGHNPSNQSALLIAGDPSPSRDFRILSSSLNRRHSHGRRISNSRSTGNLTSAQPDSLADSSSALSQKPVHHASSQGKLSSPRLTATKRQDSTSANSTPSPTRRPFTRSPVRAMQRRDRLRSPYASFDDYNSPQGEDDEEDQHGDSPHNTTTAVTFPTEPVTVLGNIIRPSTHETTARRLDIRYSARNDKYKRPTNPIRMKANGWNTLVYAERNMEWLTEHCRTGEQEEVMTYLSRKPGTSSAYVEWRFDLTEAGLRVKKCSLKFPFETFEDGHVRVYLKSDSSEEIIPVFSSLVTTDVTKMRGWDKFSLIAELECQRDACAFQHAQLFRQQLKSGFFDKQDEKYQFVMSLELYSMY